MRKIATASSGNRWFQDIILERQLDGQFFTCTEIKLAQSGKGYLLTIPVGDEDTTLFTWKKGVQGDLIRSLASEIESLRFSDSDITETPVLKASMTGIDVALGIDDEPVQGSKMHLYEGDLNSSSLILRSVELPGKASRKSPKN